MTIVPYRSWNSLGSVGDQFVNRWNFPTIERRSTHNRQPAMDVQETEEAFVFSLDVPGIRKEDIEITLEDRVLRIKGSRELKSNEGEAEGSFTRFERISGTFERSVKLPRPVDQDGVSASVQDGVLSIQVKKPVEEQPRKILVQ